MELSQGLSSCAVESPAGSRGGNLFVVPRPQEWEHAESLHTQFSGYTEEPKRPEPQAVSAWSL